MFIIVPKYANGPKLCTKVMPIVVYVGLFPNFSLLLITVHTCVLLYFEEEY